MKFYLILRSRWVEKHLKTLIISGIIYNLRKVLKFGLFRKYLSQKLTKALHPEVVSCIILMSFILSLGKNFIMYIVNIRRVYATNKNKVTIIIWSPTVFRVWLFLNEDRSRISMVWVPQLGFDPYCEGKWLSLEDKFTSSINSKKFVLQKLWTNLEKSTNIIFSKTVQPIFMTKIYVIEGNKKLLKKIQEPIPFIKRG